MKNFLLKYLVVFSVLYFATRLIWAKFGYPLTGVDDSNIFFVYAKNFASGAGFVYNIGKRVEGFTSLLWTLLCALVFKLSVKPELTLLIINIALVALGATVVLSSSQSSLFYQANQPYAIWVWSLIFLVLTFTSPAYLLWNTIALMENALWGTLLLLATLFVIGENISVRRIYWIFTPLTVLLILTRPEAFLWVPVLTAILFLRRMQTDGLIQSLKTLWPSLVVSLVTMVGLTVFRILYFGYPLPNTYYAKISPSLSNDISQGLIYFGNYFLSDPIVSISVLAVALASLDTALLFVKRKSDPGGLPFLPMIAALGLLLPVMTGGDHFGSFRFYQNIYPILVLCLLYCLKVVFPRFIHSKFNPHLPRWLTLISFFGLALLSVSSFVLVRTLAWESFKTTSEMEREFGNAKDGRETGQFIRDLFTPLPKLPSIGVVMAGGIKYTYPGEIVDLMGLNNLLMAHNQGSRTGIKNHAAFEKTTFYQLEPEIVLAKIISNKYWEFKPENRDENWFNMVLLKGLFYDRAFLDLYVYAKVRPKGAEIDKALVGWFKKDFLNDLDASNYFAIKKYE